MKVFQEREIRAALAHAAAGGQALHLMSGRYAYLRSDTPNCFKGRETIAHLFDQDCDRLVKTIRKLGVRSVRVERTGTHRQHVDLCGKPLQRAQAIAAEFILLAEGMAIAPIQPHPEVEQFLHFHEELVREVSRVMGIPARSQPSALSSQLSL